MSASRHMLVRFSGYNTPPHECKGVLSVPWERNREKRSVARGLRNRRRRRCTSRHGGRHNRRVRNRGGYGCAPARRRCRRYCGFRCHRRLHRREDVRARRVAARTRRSRAAAALAVRVRHDDDHLARRQVCRCGDGERSAAQHFGVNTRCRTEHHRRPLPEARAGDRDARARTDRAGVRRDVGDRGRADDDVQIAGPRRCTGRSREAP